MLVQIVIIYLFNIIPETIRTDGSNSMNNLDMNNNEIINLSTRTNNNDTVAKNYCDTNTLISEVIIHY